MGEMIHNKVALLRQERGMTQEELASRVDVTRQTIIALEKGNYTPSVLLALKIAKVFKADIEKIFSIRNT
jgi:putative transcriptional regulator